MSKEIITVEQIKAIEMIAEHAHASKHFEKLGGKSGIFCIAKYAEELGLPPMVCLFGGMKPVLGNIEIAPRMMNAMIRKAGHKIEIVESTDIICKLKGTRHDTKDEYICSYAIDDAKKAGLVRSGGGWEKYPSDMLFARCLSRLARRLFADVISSAYVEGEISDSEYVANSERLTTVRAEKEPEVVDAGGAKEQSMTVEEFASRLNQQTKHKHELDCVGEYLVYIQRGGKATIQNIMQQALDPQLSERFCNSYQLWIETRIANMDASSVEKV